MNHSPYQQSPAGDDKDAAAGSVGEASTVSLHVVAAKDGLRMLSTSSCLIGPTQDRCSPEAEADMLVITCFLQWVALCGGQHLWSLIGGLTVVCVVFS